MAAPRNTRGGRNPRAGRGASATCKTCTPCRRKKVRCDGARPSCGDCGATGLSCVYPRDMRREMRPSRARVQTLEDTVSAMLEHMSAAGITLPSGLRLEANDGAPRESPVPDNDSVTSAAGSLSPMAGFDASGQFDMTNFADTDTDRTAVEMSPHHATAGGESQPGGETRQPTEKEGEAAAEAVVSGMKENDSTSNGLSPCEARVAGVYHEHGCVSSVHGLASIMHPSSRNRHTENMSKLSQRGDAAIAECKARLISNAALQKQRETRMFRQPRETMDLDGCEPEMAKHLLDVHWNRQHYAYLITYRPAVMDSVVSGGPWSNKLLLNAIYYSSALYSDRECLRTDPSDMQTAGLRFYNRFRQLLVDEIDRPSVPTAAALLLTGASLVSQGRSSAGWTLSGTAFRMVLDLGCHMMLGPDYQSAASHNGGRVLRRDMELEMRKRLYWGAYVTDTTQSLYLGRPCMFASVEARVPLQLLDTFEELEDWEPYADLWAPNPGQPAYEAHPAHAVSTFTALARLFQISTRITDLYGVQSLRLGTNALLERKRSIELELENWRDALPAHMRFDPDGPFTPPPHQVTPLTTFHALTILLQRAFLEQGHLRRHSDEQGKKHGQEACISSALMIEKYVRAYRKAFSLRRAPFLLSYAVYSAVTVILHQERHDRGRLAGPISFFWTCLNELQRGCNFGLAKPLAILRELVQELRVGVEEGGIVDAGVELEPSLGESLLFRVPADLGSATMAPQMTWSGGQGVVTPESWTGSNGFDAYGSMGADMVNFLNDQERDIDQDSLFGLFAPAQNFF